MTMPPTVPFHALGNQAQFMSRQCGNERLSMILQTIALGSFIVMTGYAANQVLRDVFGDSRHDRGRGRN